MKWFLTVVLALALAASAVGARAQDKSSRVYTVVVGHVVTLNWTSSTGATSYNVYVSGMHGGPYTKIGSLTATSFADKNDIAGHTYFYVVTAVNSAGEAAFSNEVSAIIPTP